MEWLLIIVYGVSLTIICIFSLGQLNLVFHYLKRKNNSAGDGLKNFPKVTVQLPVYNEKYVIRRLLIEISKLDYPAELLEIQVLDDSDDETSDIIKETILELDSKLDISHVQREKRVGFKAGALDYGIRKAKGDFIAIFDADFLPKSDFLQKTLPYFDEDSIGMVQSRWSHINQDYSLFTRAQAFGLDAHFSVEQAGRNQAGSFINFNGTGGVWRKTCIQDAGGWQFDTLTEDLDLSYRAQLKGWKFQYVEEIDTPAELPVVLPAIKSQQYRWIKGAAETARKNLFAVIKADIPLGHKIRAVLHLLSNSVYFLLLIASLISIPLLFIKDADPTLSLVFNLGSLFLIGFLAVGIFYWVASRARYSDRTFKYYLLHFPLFMMFSMGLALHNSIATVEGYLGIKSPFIRTPKFNITRKGERWESNTYLKSSITWSTVLEGLLSLYFFFGIIAGAALGDYGLVLFHLMLAIGFGFIFTHSIRHQLNGR